MTDGLEPIASTLAVVAQTVGNGGTAGVGRAVLMPLVTPTGNPRRRYVASFQNRLALSGMQYTAHQTRTIAPDTPRAVCHPNHSATAKTPSLILSATATELVRLKCDPFDFASASFG